ncbi:Patched domain-containing protein 3 [Dirofilaria immitis]|nr:Patched domain-containing protein 3 [Dirofilaria immitis]
MTNDITDFTPRDSRALTELKIYKDFFGHKGDSITIFVFITAKDGGSMLRVQNLNETVRNGLLINEQYNGTSDQINLAYPISTILGQKFRIDDNFYGVEIGKQNALLDARLILLQFRAMLQDCDNKSAEQYELKVTNFIKSNDFKSEIIDVVSMSSSFITAEIVRAGLSLLPFTVIGFVIMCIFSAITTSITAILASQFHYYKLLIAISACISPILASATALGFLLWCGLRFGSILTSTPILVLAIGVDDAF